MKKYYWVIEATPMLDGSIKYEHADPYWFDYADAFPSGSMLVIDDENPILGGWQVVRDAVDFDEDENIFYDLGKRLGWKVNLD